MRWKLIEEEKPMLDEIAEFKAYIEPVLYAAAGKRDTSYLGRFTLDMILDFKGLSRVLTTVARGYMFPNRDTERARRALCAWCSVPDSAKEKTNPREDWQSKSEYSELSAEFPELVDENGCGWFYCHVHAVADFIRNNPEKVSKSAATKILPINKGWDGEWRKKVIQMQTPIFHPATKGAWILRFDDILADAAELDELKDNRIELQGEVFERFRVATPEKIPDNVIGTLIQYYMANKPDDSDWVVLPVTNFDAYFGNMNFSKKWLNLLPVEYYEKQTQGGVCRYRLH